MSAPAHTATRGRRLRAGLRLIGRLALALAALALLFIFAAFAALVFVASLG